VSSDTLPVCCFLLQFLKNNSNNTNNIFIFQLKIYLRLPLFSSRFFVLPLSAAKVRFSFSKIKINIIYINFPWRVAIVVVAVIHCLSLDLSLQFFSPANTARAGSCN
jgi:hypothetical protein